jgi:hypothetical protein
MLFDDKPRRSRKWLKVVTDPVMIEHSKMLKMDNKGRALGCNQQPRPVRRGLYRKFLIATVVVVRSNSQSSTFNL